MAEKTIGFRIYKCLHGWCFVRDDVDTIYTPVKSIRAFSSLSQALWHLDKRVKEIEGEDANVVRLPGNGTGAVAGGKEAGPKAQPSAARAGSPEEAATPSKPAAAVEPAA